jgi:DNA polymerase IV
VRRWIAHVDMDAFFVSVELLDRPDLRGKPVIVATGTDPTARGVVMAASYEARKFGVHSALPLAVAHRRCPQAILIPRNIVAYREMSKRVMTILEDHCDVVEVLGLDEAYLDLTDSPVPKTRARRVKHQIHEQTGLVCSIGLAPNKLLAKIASDLDKPDGFCVLDQRQWLEVVGDRPASLIPGIGPKTEEKLNRLGLKTVAALAAADPAMLDENFGPKSGQMLHRRANGIDERRVTTERERKSESRETTFAQDTDDPQLMQDALDRLVGELCRSLESNGRSGRTVTLKIRLRPFRTFTRSRTLDAPASDAGVIGRTAQELFDEFEIDAPVRLLGVGVSGMSAGERPAAEDSAELTLDV